MREHVVNGGLIHCRDIHDFSCQWEGLKRFCLVFQLAIKFYLPIHLIPALIFKRHKLKTQPMEVFKFFLKGLLRSSLMLATYIAVFRYGLCFFKNLRHKVDIWTVLYSGFIGPFVSLFWEPAGRRAELTVYMIPRFAEALWDWLVKHGVVKSIKNGELIIFAVAMAVICYSY